MQCSDMCLIVLRSNYLHMSECDDCLCTQALEGGCVLDLCLVRWPSEDWCICVAGEWSVCLWAQMKRVQSWRLLHTWTFAQVNQFATALQHKFKQLQAGNSLNLCGSLTGSLKITILSSFIHSHVVPTL